MIFVPLFSESAPICIFLELFVPLIIIIMIFKFYHLTSDDQKYDNEEQYNTCNADNSEEPGIQKCGIGRGDGFPLALAEKNIENEEQYRRSDSAYPLNRFACCPVLRPGFFLRQRENESFR